MGYAGNCRSERPRDIQVRDSWGNTMTVVRQFKNLYYGVAFTVLTLQFCPRTPLDENFKTLCYKAKGRCCR